MTPADFVFIWPHLTYVSLARGEPLVEPDQVIQHAWFIDQGIASVVATSAHGHQTEVGIVGWDGLVDMATVHGTDRASHRCFIQLPGSAYRLSSTVLQAALDGSATLRALLLAYAHSFMTQIAGTALANASYTVEQRLARWLLMCHDRIDGDEVAMTDSRISFADAQCSSCWRDRGDTSVGKCGLCEWPARGYYNDRPCRVGEIRHRFIWWTRSRL